MTSRFRRVLQRWAAKPPVRRIGLLIHPGMMPEAIGDNINGPSLVAVPDWVRNPLGRYYLYFAHHKGRYIRLAYADDIAGPWTVHERKIVPVRQVPGGKNHVASPDVHIDRKAGKLRMYFHSKRAGQPGQHTFVAESRDGLKFTVRPEPVGIYYFRAWRKNGSWWALAKGLLYRSPDGVSGFEPGQLVYGPKDQSEQQRLDGSIRHTAVCQFQGRTFVFFTRIGDSPERIFCGLLDDDDPEDWRNWTLRGEVEILRPVTDYEGATLAPTRGAPGGAFERENALRDPCYFEEKGRAYLLYAVAGENGIALAEINMAGIARLVLDRAGRAG